MPCHLQFGGAKYSKVEFKLRGPICEVNVLSTTLIRERKLFVKLLQKHVLNLSQFENKLCKI